MGIILVKNNKGGVGKTYITLQLAAYKAFIKDKKTLILTSDSQNDILKFAGVKVDDTSKFGLEDFIEGKSYKIKKLRENLFFLHLQGYKIKNSFNESFKKAINILKEEFDYKVKAIVPNRIGRTKLEKEYYDFLNKKLSVQGIHLSFPIPQLSLISKLIDNETLLWESKAQKLDYIKGIFISIWKEIDNE